MLWAISCSNLLSSPSNVAISVALPAYALFYSVGLCDPEKKESVCSERLAVDIAFLVMNGDVVIGVFVVVSFLVSPPNEFGVNQESHSLAAALLRILPKFKAPGTCVFYSSPLSFLSFPFLFFLSFFWLFILYLHRSLVVALDRICSPWKPVFMLPRENCLKEKPLSVGRTAYLQPDT